VSSVPKITPPNNRLWKKDCIKWRKRPCLPLDEFNVYFKKNRKGLSILKVPNKKWALVVNYQLPIQPMPQPFVLPVEQELISNSESFITSIKAGYDSLNLPFALASRFSSDASSINLLILTPPFVKTQQ